MGILFSRFRKKKTTIEILEDLDMKIKEIQSYGQTTEQRHKKIVGRLIIYSVVLYIIAALVFYFYFFPASLRDRFFYIIPLLLFPLLIILTKRMVTFYYNRKISRNQDKLSTMQKEKKKILDDVTETETYKKAKEILLKFAPDQLRMTPLSPQPAYKPAVSESPRRPSTPQAVVAPLPGAGELRRRALTMSNTSATMSTGRPVNSSHETVGLARTPPSQTPFQTGMRSQNTSMMGPRSPLPRPILPQNRSYLDRLVEYLVGDGPSNRYALICQVCDSHNGMALKEEFEYFGFRCCYCNFWNPARKQKPSAPKLERDLSSTLSSSLQTHKDSKLDVSSSSVERSSEICSHPMSPIIEDLVDAHKLNRETTVLFSIPSARTKSIELKKRRRTMYQIKSYETSESFYDYTSEADPLSPINMKSICLKSQNENFDGLLKDSDIEVVDKPSEQSETDTEKVSNSDLQKADEKDSSGDDDRITKLEEATTLAEESQEAPTENMEVDESPMK